MKKPVDEPSIVVTQRSVMVSAKKSLYTLVLPGKHRLVGIMLRAPATITMEQAMLCSHLGQVCIADSASDKLPRFIAYSFPAYKLLATAPCDKPLKAKFLGGDIPSLLTNPTVTIEFFDSPEQCRYWAKFPGEVKLIFQMYGAA